MNPLLEFSANPTVQAVGWTLIHFAWQGFAIAAIWYVAQILLRNRSANARYLAGCAALCLMALAPVTTIPHLHTLSQPETTKFEISSGLQPIDNLNAGQTTLSSTPIVLKLPLRLRELSLTARVQNALRLLVGYPRVRQIRRCSIEPMDSPWETALRSLSHRLAVIRPVELCKSAWVEVPTVIGWLRPIILFPASALAGLSPAQIEAILAHELAHIRRNDYVVNLFQNVLETLLFYHPAVWWISRQVSEEREQCCDELAIEICGDRIVYARALAVLEETRGETNTLVLAAGGGSLLSRIRRILGVPAHADRTSWWLAGTIALVLVCVLAVVGSRSLRAQESGSNADFTNQPEVPSLVTQARHMTLKGNIDEAIELLEATQEALPEGSEADYYLNYLRRIQEPFKKLTIDTNSNESASYIPDLDSTAASNETLNLGFEIFDLPNLSIPNSGWPLQHMVYSRALRVELARTISQVSGVESAQVLIDEKYLGRFFQDRLTEPTVSVSIRPTRNASIAEQTLDSIRSLVTRAVFAGRVVNVKVLVDADNRERGGEFSQSTRLVSDANAEPILPKTSENDEQSTEIALAPKQETASEIIQFARTLVEVGKFDEAVNALERALELEPQHQGALYYHQYIQEVKRARESRRLEILSAPKPDLEPGSPVDTNRLAKPRVAPSSNPFQSSPERERIARKLDRLILDEFPTEWEHGTPSLKIPLPEALRQLDQEVIKIDPEKRGINYILNTRVPRPSEAPTNDQLDLRNDAIVVFGAPLRNVRARDVLDAICKLTQSKKDGRPFPLKYSIQDYAVVFSSALSPEIPQLFTRVFRLDPKAFLQQLDKLDPQNLGPVGAREGSDLSRLTLGGSEDGIRSGSRATALKKVNERVREFFRKAGVEFQQTDFGPLTTPARNASQNQMHSVPLKAIFFDDQAGHLFVRATSEDLDIIEQVIQSARAVPRQVKLEVRFVEMNEWDAKDLGLDGLLNSAATETNRSTGESEAPLPKETNPLPPEFHVLPGPRLLRETNITGSRIVGIVSSPEFQVLIRALEQRGGVDVVATPKMTTTDGLQARVSVGQPKTIVSQRIEGSRASGGGTNQVFIGPTVDILPQVTQDGSSIELSILGRLTEFLGYDDTGPYVQNTPIEELPRPASPQPRFRTRTIQGHATVADGRTLILGAAPIENTVLTKDKVPILGDIPFLGRLFRKESKEKRKMCLFVFVTPTLVDSSEVPKQQ